ncbi:chromophore lyase CpcT/CpeT [Algimonas porphyrae]|uniref:Uncharacterized protein n=2 Tax=Algimonas porphyrae TaxID=1128113 RepID=A0ABQ5UZZ3_9PROT|nr:chromophore lyase CpcT/CpeT [Algimonas porphyrae]GLQ20728.1 hypothetical protein GCM10007854_16830 [Algimonas porphyrae]
MRFLPAFLLLTLLPGACLSSDVVPQADDATPETSLTAEQQLARFVTIFPGRYDSTRQWLDEARSDQRNYRRHSIFRRVEVPALGDIVFLAHQYRDGDPQKVYRQRLYTLSLADSREDAAFRLRVHVPRTDDMLAGAYRDPSPLSVLGPDDFTVWEGCDLFWSLDRRDNQDRFVGTLDEGACRFSSDAFAQDIVLEETLTLTADGITFADRGLSLTGDWLFGMRGAVPNISLKVRPFLCQSGIRTAWLHDQGGTSDALGFPIRLDRLRSADMTGLRLTIPFAEQRDLTVLDRWDAEQISLDAQDRRVVCRHAPETLYSETIYSEAD